LSANCRQSAAAKRFIGWISGGEGGQTVRQQISGMTDIRKATPSSGQSDPVSGGTGGYDSWLADRLRSPLTLPTVQLLRAGEYYQALDSQVRRALDGQITPADALSQVAKQWQATTEKVGLKKQLRAWRRAQGMRA
jgi:ABC-type glycerol-3-phosphate transport system substrate-binding protein